MCANFSTLHVLRDDVMHTFMRISNSVQSNFIRCDSPTCTQQLVKAINVVMRCRSWWPGLPGIIFDIRGAIFEQLAPYFRGLEYTLVTIHYPEMATNFCWAIPPYPQKTSHCTLLANGVICFAANNGLTITTKWDTLIQVGEGIGSILVLPTNFIKITVLLKSIWANATKFLTIPR